jgi:hypothetical protein
VRLAAWQAQVSVLQARRDAAAAAKARADAATAGARTQQDVERAERLAKEAAVELKVGGGCERLRSCFGALFVL